MKLIKVRLTFNLMSPSERKKTMSKAKTLTIPENVEERIHDLYGTGVYEGNFVDEEYRKKHGEPLSEFLLSKQKEREIKEEKNRKYANEIHNIFSKINN